MRVKPERFGSAGASGSLLEPLLLRRLRLLRVAVLPLLLLVPVPVVPLDLLDSLVAVLVLALEFDRLD